MCQPHARLTTVCACVAGPEIFHGWSTKVLNDLHVWRSQGLIHPSWHQWCWDTEQLSQSGHAPTTLLRGPTRTPEDNSELSFVTWRHNFVIIGPFWGAEDTKSPPPLSLVTTFWTWLLMKDLPFFMRHWEGQRPFVQITMYNIVLCIIFWRDFNCNYMRTYNNTKKKKKYYKPEKRNLALAKKMFLKAHPLAAVIQTALTQKQL